MPIVLLILHLIVVFFMGPCPPPAQMDTNWFVNTYTYDYGALPVGVTIQKQDTQLLMMNTSATPLYVLGPDRGQDTYDIPVKVPGLVPQYMFVNGEAYAWQPDRGGWVYQSGGLTPMNFAHLRNGAEIWAHVPRNTDRPANVALPEPISMRIYLIYDGQITDLFMRTTFALNPNYMREPPAPPTDCGSLMRMVITVVIMLVLFIIIGVSVWFYRSYRAGLYR